jgi:uncharacterized membrane protein
MTVALVILGLILGGSTYRFPGALLGAALGYAIGELYSVSRRLRLLEQEVAELRRKQGPQASVPSGEGVIPDSAPASAVSPTGHFNSIEETFTFDESRISSVETFKTTDSTRAESATRETASLHEEKPAAENPLAAMLNRFLTGGHLLVKVGIVILFIGVSFLVKYAAEHELFPIELRLAAAAAGGIVLLVIGWRLRDSRDVYAQVLQGGGVGILYLTTFAAFRLYSLIPPAPAFSILVAVAVLSAMLSVLQNACPLAVIGVSGGFLAPVLTSTGGGNHVFLFSYYALLNCGIIGIAWFRAWRILNLIGFFFTFIIGAAWGYRYYQPEYFASTEPFLNLFFAVYVAIAILFAIRQEPDLKGYLDGTLVFGTPVVAFALQAMLVRQYRYGLAWSALGLGLLYIPLAWIMFLRRPRYMRTLIEAFFAFGVVFATLAIPLALDNRWTSAAWALEGAGILWAGLRQGRKLARIFGILLIFGAGFFFLADATLSTGGMPILNGYFLGCVLLAFSGVFSSFCLFRQKEKVASWEYGLGTVLFVWGLSWWFGGGLHEIDRHMPHDFRMGGILAFSALSCGACDYLERRLAWLWLNWPALCLLPIMCLVALTLKDSGLHPFSQLGFVGWPFAFVVYYRVLNRQGMVPGNVLKFLHAGTFWLIAIVLTLEMRWRMDNLVNGADTWAEIAWGFTPALLALILTEFGVKQSWLIKERHEPYLSLCAGPVILAAWLWAVFANLTSPGDSDPLGWLPILNPLDVTTGLVFVVLAVWFARLSSGFPAAFFSRQSKALEWGYAASLFLWVNAILVRTIHHWGGVEFSFSPLFSSVLLQASLSIFWSVLALCVMVIATRGRLRTIWLAGAGLLAVVVIKLFLVDLSKTGTVARIVSFVGVGILLLVIGYLSPVPPRGREADKI